MSLELVGPGDPMLRRPSEPFDFEAEGAHERARELAEGLEAKMRELNGLGLSAVQVGIPVRAFAMKTEPDVTIFNPRIVDVSEETVELEEGCLSFPGILVKVRRPKLIKARFQLMDGDTRTMKFSGMTARILLHELDHLDGKLFTQGLSRLKMEMALKKAKKRGFNYTLSDLR